MKQESRQSGECGFTVTLKEGKTFPDNFDEMVHFWYQSNVPYVEAGTQADGITVSISDNVAEIYFEFGYDINDYEIEPYSPATMWEPEYGGFPIFHDYYKPEMVEEDFKKMLHESGLNMEDVEEIVNDVEIDGTQELEEKLSEAYEDYEPDEYRDPDLEEDDGDDYDRSYDDKESYDNY